MDCPSCENTVRSAVEKMPGVRRIESDHLEMSLTIEGEGDEFQEQQLIEKIRNIGYKPKRAEKQELEPETGNKWLKIFIVLLPAATLITGFALQFAGYPTYVTIPLFLATIAISGYDTIHKGLLAIFRLSLDMNSLMTLAVTGAMIIGEWGEGATVMFLMGVSNFLEGWSRDRSRAAVRKLMELAPPTAIVQRDGTEVEVTLEEIAVGERMIVKPGGRIPLDGRVISGSSAVDQSPITGESVPVPKDSGEELFAGSINGDGTLIVEATATVEDSTVARIIHMVQEARSRKAPTERFIDRFAKIYTPAAVGIASLIAIVPPLFLGDWSMWFYRGLVLLVIACPCALVISTPVGIVSGLASAARAGVLIKGGRYIETTSRVTTVAFDKTGTLTHGRPRVLSIVPLDGVGSEELLRLAASLERHAEHPLAAAVVREAKEQNLALSEPSEVQALPGRGVIGKVGEKQLSVGSSRMFREHGLFSNGNENTISEVEEAGQTTICVAADERIIGYIALGDELRAEAKDSIKELGKLGVSSLMITGDNKNVATTVGSSLAIEETQAELLPEDKLATLAEHQSNGKVVMMVGDGINDAPALTAADVGVAMGAAGTDVALESADVALMGDDLSKVPFTISHSRRTMNLIRQNIFFSIATKLAFVALAVGGLATLWMAVLADTGLTVAVTLNSLRLMRTKEVG